MRWPTRKRDMADGHFVEHGRVWCPARRCDIDIDRCMVCGSFEDLTRDGTLEILYCRPTSNWVEYEASLVGR